MPPSSLPLSQNHMLPFCHCAGQKKSTANVFDCYPHFDALVETHTKSPVGLDTGLDTGLSVHDCEACYLIFLSALFGKGIGECSMWLFSYDHFQQFRKPL